jgi:hypothetical protein
MDVWVIADTNSAIFQLYYGENKVIKILSSSCIRQPTTTPKHNRIGGLMVSVLASSEVDRGSALY